MLLSAAERRGTPVGLLGGRFPVPRIRELADRFSLNEPVLPLKKFYAKCSLIF